MPNGIDEKELWAPTIAASLERSVRSLEAEGIKVVLFADTPWLSRSGPECLSDPQYVPGSCDVSMKRVKARKDPVLILSGAQPDIGVIRMNQHLCDAHSCKVIIDGRIVFKDSHHLTAHFSASLAREIGTEISRFLP